ncbi:MAG: hypothetical protein QW756_00560 [Nitrososphaerota archaeon]
MRKLEVLMLVVASLAAVSVGVVAASSMQYQAGFQPAHWRFPWRGGPHGPWGNVTVNSEEIVVSGVIADAEFGRLVVDASGQTVNMHAPPLWNVTGSVLSYFRLFAEDFLNKGDRVEMTVMRITITGADGQTLVRYFVKTIRDLTTGIEASSIPTHHLRREGISGSANLPPTVINWSGM